MEISANALLFYILVIVMVRVVGKRTISEFNNFDWIINFAVGSLAASGILLRNVASIDALAELWFSRPASSLRRSLFCKVEMSPMS